MRFVYPVYQAYRCCRRVNQPSCLHRQYESIGQLIRGELNLSRPFTSIKECMEFAGRWLKEK